MPHDNRDGSLYSQPGSITPLEIVQEMEAIENRIAAAQQAIERCKSDYRALARRLDEVIRM